MHIANIMFSTTAGGIEQACVDYCEALSGQGVKVSAIIHPDAAIRPSLLALQRINTITMKNLGAWDPFAKAYLKKILTQIRPDAVIVHGNRAVSLATPAARQLGIPVVGVTHNYKLKHQIGLDAMFATTEDLQQALITLGQKKEAIYRVPNMVRLEDASPKPAFRQPPVIGAMGRFVKKKGFDVFIEALAILKDEGVAFTAKLGGGGEEEQALRSLPATKKLERQLNLTGWIKNKKEFFDSIDIFCLPSLHEPFGIILLEACMFRLPIVTTDSEGPSEIVTHGKDALMVQKNNPKALADALKQLLVSPPVAEALAKEAAETVKAYDINVVGAKMREVLEVITAKTL